MIRFENVLINKEYIGYAYVKEVVGYEGKTTWRLNINFMNDNKEKDYLMFVYTTEKEASDKLNELEQLLRG